MLRANSRLNNVLSSAGLDLLIRAAGAIERILPHVGVSPWTEAAWGKPGCVWATSDRTEIRVTLAIGKKESAQARSLHATVTRRSLPVMKGKARRTLDTREYEICDIIADRISKLFEDVARQDVESLNAIGDTFDESVVARHIQEHHELDVTVSTVFDALHKLSEQTYENKALTFGCILDPAMTSTSQYSRFPGDFLTSKKYKALSDGFRTAYHISKQGYLTKFVDLERAADGQLSEKHYFPDWSRPMAGVSRKGRCGIALSRQGDMLLFDEGTLRFTYRYGHWQYWNHSHLINLLHDRTRAQKASPKTRGRVVGALYRAAIDVSFRRSGGLFIILHNRKSLRKLVRRGDAIGDKNRSGSDLEFDQVLAEHTIQSLPRVVTVELASLDGAIVVDNSGRILAYGAVLNPKKAGRLRGSEGSRTKAAIGASNYGLALKISSDGDITVYHNGKEFIRM